MGSAYPMLVEALLDIRDLVSRLPAEVYGKTPSEFTSSIGKQVRHVVDMISCLQAGIAGGAVDYARRKRESAIETVPAAGQGALSIAAQQTDALALLPGSRTMLVAAELRSGAPTASTLGREVEFLLSHTIHHQALIRAICLAHGVRVSEHFGVADSTRRHYAKQPVDAGYSEA